MTPDPVTILQNSRFFMSVRGPSFERLKAMVLLRRYERATMVFREGDECPGVFVVGSGLVRIYKSSPAGREHVLHLVSPGGTFAEVAAIGGFKCPAFAEALEDSACALLPASAFGRALREDHQLCLQLMMSMCGWVKHLVGQVEDIALRDALGRVSRYLAGVADPADGRVRLPSLKKHLASHLNLTSETLSRTLRRLTDMGIIDPDDEQGLVIRDPDSLRGLADGEFPLI
jgi:CRP/FNR family transcriptional regulator, dissimilatory nitrate respiration regulator